MRRITIKKFICFMLCMGMVFGLMPVSAIAEDETPTPAASHTLTVSYVYEDGTAAAPTHTESVAEGASYNVASPEVAGFTPSANAVSGTMGTADVTESVVYSAVAAAGGSKGLVSVTFYASPADGSVTGAFALQDDPNQDGIITVSVESGTLFSAVTKPIPTASGKIFHIWNPALAGDTAITEDTVLHAQYRDPKSYTLTFAAGEGGSVSANELTVAEGTSWADIFRNQIVATPDEGLLFAGWSPAIPDGVINDNSLVSSFTASFGTARTVTFTPGENVTLNGGTAAVTVLVASGTLWENVAVPTIGVTQGHQAEWSPAKPAGDFVITENVEYTITVDGGNDTGYAHFSFYVDDQLWAEQTVADGETLLQPATPDDLDHQRFTGWYNFMNAVQPFGVINTSAYATEVRVDAVFEDVYYATFLKPIYAADGTFSHWIVADERAAAAGETINTDVTFDVGAEKALIGWRLGDSTTGTLYATDASYTVPTADPADVTFYADVRDVKWITFVTGTGATYFEPEYTAGSAYDPTGKTPVRDGYTFVGWSVNPDATAPDAYPVAVTDDIVLYAIWTANTDTGYTVVYWLETAAAGHTEFIYEGSASATGTTGAAITLTNVQTSTDNITSNPTGGQLTDAEYRACFHYDHCDTDRTVASDGSTVVNVYFYRNTYTLTFTGSTSVVTYTKYTGNKNGRNYPGKYALVNGAYIKLTMSNYSSYTGYDWYTKTTTDTPFSIAADYEYDQDLTAAWNNETVKGLSDAGYVWKSSLTNAYYSFLQKMPNSDLTLTAYNMGTGKTWHYYLETLDGTAATAPAGATTVTYDGKVYYQFRSASANATDLTYDEDYYAITGFTQKYAKGEDGWNYNNDYHCYAKTLTDGMILYYERSSFTLTYHNVNAVAKTETVRYETPLLATTFGAYVPPKPVGEQYADYAFVGWYTSPACEAGTEAVWSTGENVVTMPASNRVVYAKWAPKTVNGIIYINLAGDETAVGGAPYTVTSGSAIPTEIMEGFAAQVVVPENMELAGWLISFEREDGTYTDYIPFNTATALTSNIKLKPSFVSTLEIQIVYEIDPADTGVTGSVPSDPTWYPFADAASAKIMGKNDLIRDGYVFVGWRGPDGVVYQPGSTMPIDFALAVADTAGDYYYHMTAAWDAIPARIFVTYNANYDGAGAGPTVGGGSSVAANSLVTLRSAGTFTPAADANGGTVTFIGWNTAANGSGTAYAAGAEARFGASTVLYAQYKTEYTVTFLPGDHAAAGTETVTQTYQKGAAIAAPEAPASADAATYAFDGWAPQGTDPALPANANGNYTYVAQWKTLTAQLTVNYVYEDDTEAAATHTETVSIGGAYSVTSPGITGFTADIETVAGTMVAGGVTETVTYTRNSYTLTYFVDGVQHNQTTVAFDAAITALTEPTKEGYTFSGWDSDPAQTGNQPVPANMPAHDVNVYGTFAVNSYNVTYYVDNVQSGDPDAYNFGAAITVRGGVAKTGYTFKGWDFDSATAGIQSAPVTMPANDLRADAVYEINSYTLTIEYRYDSATGETAAATHTATLDYGAAYSVTSPVIAGYTADTLVVEGNMPAGNKDVTVIYTANEDTPYKVEFYYQDATDGTFAKLGYVPRTGTTRTYVEVTENDMQPDSGLHDEALFYVLDSDNADNVWADATLNGDGTTVLKVYFKLQMTVTYSYTGTVPSDATALPATAKVDYGAEVALAPAATAVGHTFSGWTVTDGTLSEGVITVGGSNVAVTGSFTINDYTLTVTYEMSDGTTAPDAIVRAVHYGATYGVNSPEIDGYTPDKATVVGTMPAADVSVTVTYTPNEDTAYTVEHYKAELDGTYPTTPTDTDNMTGTTGEQTAAVAKTYAGFTAQTFSQTTIAGDGSTVIEIYYTRNTYTVLYLLNGSVAATETRSFGETLTQQADEDGLFSGWVWSTEDGAMPETMPANNLTVYGMTATSAGYTGVYDAEAHGITVTPDIGGASVKYIYNAEEYTENPQFVNANETGYQVGFIISYQVENGPELIIQDDNSVIITPRALTLKIVDQTKVYLADDPTLTGSDAVLLGWITGETPAFDGIPAYVRSYKESDVGIYDDAIGQNTIELADNAAGNFLAANYTIGTVVKGTLTITASDAMSASAEDIDVVYNGQNHHITVTVKIGDAEVTDATVTYGMTEGEYDEDASPDRMHAGTYTVYYQVEKANYATVTGEATITIAKRPILITAGSDQVTYDGVEHTVTDYTLETCVVNDENTTDSGRGLVIVAPDTHSDMFANGTVSVTGGTGTDVGTYETNAQLSEGYKIWSPVNVDVTNDYTIEYKAGALVIDPKAVTVTANDKTKVFGEDDPALDAAVDGTLGTDTVAYTVDRDAGEDVGTYTITPSGDAEQGNYTVTYAEGTLTITASGAMTVSGTDYSGTYDGAAHGVTATPSVEDGTTVRYSATESTDPADYTLTESPTATNADEDMTVYFVATNKNYAPAFGSATVTVDPKPLALDLADKTKEYLADDPTLSAADAVFTGMVSGETAVFTGVPAYDESHKDDPAGTYMGAIGKGTVTLADGTGANKFLAKNYVIYIISYGNLTIKPATAGLSITVSDYKGTYDGQAHSSIATATASDGSTSKIEYSTDGGDNWSTAAPTITDVDIVTVLVRATNKNYQTVDAFYKLTVTPKELTLTLQSKTKEYLADDPTLGAADAVFMGEVEGETAVFTGVPAYDESHKDDPAGTYAGAIEKGTVTLADGTDTNKFLADNYTIAITVKGDLTITGNTTGLTVTGVPYEGTYDGKAHGEAATATASDGSTSKIEYSIDGGTAWSTDVPQVTDVADSVTVKVRATNDNYAMATATYTLTVNKVAIVLTAADGSWTYDGAAHSKMAYSITGAFVTGEGIHTVIFDGASVTDVADSGTLNTIVGLTLTEDTLAGNYTVTYAPGTLEITPQAVTITAQDASKTYDGTALTEAGFSNTALATTDTHVFAVVMTEDSTITDVGTQPNVIAKVDGTAVTTGTEIQIGNYLVTTAVGELEITLNTTGLTVTGVDYTGDYDGKAHGSAATATASDGSTSKIEYSTDGGTNWSTTVPQVKNVVDSVTVKVRATNKNYQTVTGEYSLTVFKVSMALATDDATWVYDGNAHTKHTYTILSGAFVGEEGLSGVDFDTDSNITDVGTVKNKITAIRFKTNTDATNYSVHITRAGTLTIEPLVIGITVGDNWKYETYADPDPLAEVTVTALNTTLGEGQTLAALAAKAKTALKDLTVSRHGADETVGMKTEDLRCSMQLATGEDGDNYHVVPDWGDFEIRERPYFHITYVMYGLYDYAVAGNSLGFGYIRLIGAPDKAVVYVQFSVQVGEKILDKVPQIVDVHPQFVEGFTVGTWNKILPETMPEGDIIVGCFYKLRDMTYTVNYYLDGTTTKLAASKTVDTVYWAEIQAADEAIAIDGYTFKNGDPATLTVTDDTNVLNLYYTEDVPGQPTPVPTPETTPTPTTEPVDIPDNPTPAAGPHAWALVNLLLTICTAIAAIVLLIGLAGRKKKEDDEGVQKKVNKKIFWRWFSLVPAIGAIIAFLLTELPLDNMIYVDWWTILMAVIAVIQIVVIFLSRKKTEDPDEEQSAPTGGEA